MMSEEPTSREQRLGIILLAIALFLLCAGFEGLWQCAVLGIVAVIISVMLLGDCNDKTPEKQVTTAVYTRPLSPDDDTEMMAIISERATRLRRGEPLDGYEGDLP